MHKALYPRDDADRCVSIKGGRGLTSIEEC